MNVWGKHGVVNIHVPLHCLTQSFSSCLFVLGLWGGAGAASYGALITFGLMFGLTAGSWAALLYSVIRECSCESTFCSSGVASYELMHLALR